MGPLRAALPVAFAVALAIPTAADAARAARCDGIGTTITNLRAKGLPCDAARTLSAKWIETAATGGGRVTRIDEFRCTRRSAGGSARAVRCTGAGAVVSFRARLP